MRDSEARRMKSKSILFLPLCVPNLNPTPKILRSNMCIVPKNYYSHILSSVTGTTGLLIYITNTSTYITATIDTKRVPGTLVSSITQYTERYSSKNKPKNGKCYPEINRTVDGPFLYPVRSGRRNGRVCIFLIRTSILLRLN